MRKSLMIVLNTLAMVLVATAAFAADGTGFTNQGLATIGLGIAAAFCGLGQGMTAKAACEGTARNPEASGKIQTLMILGLAFIESLTIYALVAIFLV